MDFRVRDLIFPYLLANKLAGYCFRDALRNETPESEKKIFIIHSTASKSFIICFGPSWGWGRVMQ